MRDGIFWIKLKNTGRWNRNEERKRRIGNFDPMTIENWNIFEKNFERRWSSPRVESWERAGFRGVERRFRGWNGDKGAPFQRGGGLRRRRWWRRRWRRRRRRRIAAMLNSACAGPLRSSRDSGRMPSQSPVHRLLPQGNVRCVNRSLMYIYIYTYK